MSTEVDIQTVLADARGIALDLSSAAVRAFESRCAITKGECDGLHYSACRSRLPRGECTTNAMTLSECLEEDCGSVQDFSNPVGERVDAAISGRSSAGLTCLSELGVVLHANHLPTRRNALRY